jgi:lysophospholipase L1-like esterase
LSVVPLGGQAEICGAVIESDPTTSPGVVLDTLGINGARLTTPLAWDETSWVTELSRRKPALVVVEYGTNEASDADIVADAFSANLRTLLARARAASPDADCLVLGPTDRTDQPDTIPKVRRALADAARDSLCMFWDTYTVMGGQGANRAWFIRNPPRAASDGVHLTPRGYRDLGARLARDLLARYMAYASR